MKLNWECLNEDYCFRTPAPLFGNIRVERYSENKRWSIDWSVPGYGASLTDDKWDTAEEAMKAAEDYIAEACAKFLGVTPDHEWRSMDDAPTDGTPVEVYAGAQGWDGKGVVCAAFYGRQWRIYGVINGMPGPDRNQHSVQWLSEIEPEMWRPLPAGPGN